MFLIPSDGRNIELVKYLQRCADFHLSKIIYAGIERVPLL